MVMDFDFKSEYPSMICSFNIGEMTFMFRMRRIGNQWVGLTGTARYDNISNVVEAYTSRDWFTLTNDYFGFPNAKEIVRRFVREALVA
jgi:DNA polymerase elongation subunit (family B)